MTVNFTKLMKLKLKLEFIKGHGRSLSPASDEVADKMQKFKSNEMYVVDIKLTRNPAFLRKAFAFFNFCFEHWSAGKTHWEHMNESSQKEAFRKELTKLAGFTVTSYAIDGLSFVVEAKSLSFGSMDEDEFRECYSALINAAIKSVFMGTNDEQILNKLMGFF